MERLMEREHDRSPPPLLRSARISFARRALAALTVLVVTASLSKLHENIGLVPLLDGRTSSPTVDLLAIHSLLRLPSGNSTSASDTEYDERGASPSSRAALPTTTTSELSVGLDDEDGFLGRDRVNERASLPAWINDYLSWHDQQLKQINEDNWREFRYLVFRCLRQDAKCGGASDRIHPVPYGLMLANRTRRVLLIDWTRPCPLEEFLVPPPGGINWTVPSFVQFNYRNNPAISSSGKSESKLRDDDDVMLIDVRDQSNDHGRLYYDSHLDDPATEPTFESIYHRVWGLFFTPSPAVASVLRRTERTYGLVPGRYVSLHIRALYAKNHGSNEAMVRNAVHCASGLRPGSPIFVASDSPVASSYAIRYGRQIGVRVVAREANAPPLHIDRGGNFLTNEGADWMLRNASDFYDTFVDLYLLAGGSCSAFNIGGYGRWTNLISSNSSCYINHHRNKCDYHPGNRTGPSLPSRADT